jgi:hypothetical protein
MYQRVVADVTKDVTEYPWTFHCHYQLGSTSIFKLWWVTHTVFNVQILRHKC